MTELRRVSIPRLRRVRFKDGRASIEIFSPLTEHGENNVRKIIEGVLGAHDEPIAGAAFIVWAPSGRTTSDLCIQESSNIPWVLIPTLVGETVAATLSKRRIMRALGKE